MTQSRDHRVLILEDEGDVVEVIREALEPLALNIATANTADGMQKLISSNFFDTIILDNAMPFMTGIELVQKIREQRVTTPVVFVSGGISQLDQQDMKKLGAIDFFPKPFSGKELRESVARAVVLGTKLAALETTLTELQEMGAMSSSACDSFKHLLLTLLQNPREAL